MRATAIFTFFAALSSAICLASSEPSPERQAAAEYDRILNTIISECDTTWTDEFYGFPRFKFKFKGCEAWVVCPNCTPKEGNPWTWTMQWATAYVPRTNVLQMLHEGYHHVTINTFDYKMNADGLTISAEFQKFLVHKLGFAPKALLVGMSWGGFFSVRYSVNYPDNVRAVYLDCPLLIFTEFRSDIGPWEGLMPNGGWKDCPEMPLNMSERLAATGIPVLLLYGGQDATCLPSENSEAFIERFKAAGGNLTFECRECYGHHPHGVEINETTIKDFFEAF